MKSFLKVLFYDNDLVKTIRQAHTEKEHLYSLLFTGKITMKEYLAAGV